MNLRSIFHKKIHAVNSQGNPPRVLVNVFVHDIGVREFDL